MNEEEFREVENLAGENEDKISELEMIIEDHAKSLSKLENEYTYPKIITELSKLSFPFGVQSEINSKIKIDERSFQDMKRVLDIKNKKFKNPLSIRNIDQMDDIYQLSSLKIKSGMEYMQHAQNSSHLNKSVLIYYSISQIYSGVIDWFFNVDFTKHHGLVPDKSDFDSQFNWNFRILPGFVEKLITIVEIISPGTAFFNFFKKPDQGNIIGGEFSKIFPNFNRNQNLEIINKRFPYKTLEENMNSEYGFSNKGVIWNSLVLDFINLFMFSSYSRYRPILWDNFLAGKTEMYKIYVETIDRVPYHINWFISHVQRFKNEAHNMYRLVSFV